MIQFIYFALSTLSLSLSLCFAGADKYAYPPQKISLRGIEEIKIIGVKGAFRAKGRKRGSNLTLRVQHSKSRAYDDWHLEVERKGKVLNLEVFNVAFGRQWNAQIRKELWPEFDIAIESAPLPVTMAWREGSIEYTNWNAKLDITFLNGKSKIHGGTGNVSIQAVDAQVEVAERQGELNIKGDSGSVDLRQIVGDLNLNWLKGKIRLKQCSGQQNIEARQSDLLVNGGAGILKIVTEEGQAQIRDFAGLLEGKSAQASWNVHASAPANLHLSTSTGLVALQWVGGGKVFLTSNAGNIEIERSDFLSNEKRDGHRVAEGVKTAKVMGQVFVHTDSGGINWRQ